MYQLKSYVFLCLWLFTSWAYAFETILYAQLPDKPVSSSEAPFWKNVFKEAEKIGYFAPQILSIDPTGKLTVSSDLDFLPKLKQHHIKWMPLVINVSEENNGFDLDAVHRFLLNPDAQQTAIQNLVNFCKQYQCDALQVDFEHMPINDRPLFTEFYRELAEKIHELNISISIALIPKIGREFSSAYDQWRRHYWSGVFDYRKIGEISDFVSLMTYDEHTRRTTPGPIASVGWVEDLIQHALSDIPAHKISLGMPTYSRLWFTKVENDELVMKTNALSYEDVLSEVRKNNLTDLTWNPVDANYYAILRKGSLYDYLFIEEIKSFNAKITLVDKYKLGGISLWRAGLEDSRIWQQLAIELK